MALSEFFCSTLSLFKKSNNSGLVKMIDNSSRVHQGQWRHHRVDWGKQVHSSFPSGPISKFVKNWGGMRVDQVDFDFLSSKNVHVMKNAA